MRRRITKIKNIPQISKEHNPSKKVIRPVNSINRNVPPLRPTTFKPLDAKNLENEVVPERMPSAKQQPKRGKIFIIGGGPSLKYVDLNLLEDQVTMCVNAAINIVPKPTYFVSMDYSFFSKGAKYNVDHIVKKVQASYFILNKNNPGLEFDTAKGMYIDKRPNVNLQYRELYKFTKVVESVREKNLTQGFSSDWKGFCHGYNSGFCAIQLAILLGYTEIVLLGFDLGFDQGVGGETHFHNHYGTNTNIRTKIDTFKAHLMDSIRKYKPANVADNNSSPIIFNTITPGPLETIMPKVTLENVLNMNLVQKLVSVAHTLCPLSVKQKDYIIVAYYTVNTPYEEEAHKLRSSLERLGIPHDIVGVDNLGNWQANTRFKAKFMREMLDKHKGINLVYLDADAIVHSDPVLFDDYECDIAVRWQDFRWRKNECLSGTIYMANNSMTRELCKRWATKNSHEGNNPKTFEQWNLGYVIEEMRDEGLIKDKNLPPEYTMIFDSMRGMYPNIDPVIEHFQASRTLRNKV